MKKQVFRLRPVLKNEKELEEEKKQYFELPRKNTEQISAAVKRLQRQTQSKEGDFQSRWHLLRRILRRARYKNIDENVVPYLKDMDRSDQIVPNGEVSRKLYEDVFHAREFDLYGNLRPETRHPPRKFMELQLLASQLGIEFTQKMDERFETIKIDEEAEEEAARQRRLKALPKLATAPWKIGKKEVTYGPVGLANNPIQPSNSLGNEPYYSYDGEWKDGKMHGTGVYLFHDGKTYSGEFQRNRPHGKGQEFYLGNMAYEGEFANGDHHGVGHSFTVDGKGVDYKGDHWGGFRHGQGKLTYPSGMTYEGEFQRGVPHGRGIMRSRLTNWAYEGTFENGYILGSGVLISPSKERIVYYWADAKQPMSLPSLVRHYLDSKDDDRVLNDQRQVEMYSQLRAVQLREYVAGIRNQLYQERVAEKRTRYQEAVQKVKEQKAKLYETRLKALVGEEEDETASVATGSRPGSGRAATTSVSGRSEEGGGEEEAEAGEEGGEEGGAGEGGTVAPGSAEEGGEGAASAPAAEGRVMASARDESRKSARPKEKPKDKDKSAGKPKKKV